MNDLIRPPLYDAFHFIWPVKIGEEFTPQRRDKDLQLASTEVIDVVGPICESADFFAKDRELSPVKAGDYIAITGTGAYGQVLSSNYNLRPKIPEYLIRGSKVHIIFDGETLESMAAKYRW